MGYYGVLRRFFIKTGFLCSILSLLFITFVSCKSIKNDSFLANDFFLLGNQYMELKKYPEAIQYYLKSLDYLSDNDKVIVNLILAYQKNNEFNKAEDYIVRNYNRSRMSDEYTRIYLKLLANNHFYANRLPLAERTYRTYTETYTNDPEAFFNLGLCLYLLDRKDEGVEFFNKALTVDQNFIPALKNIGDHYFIVKDMTNAYIYYTRLKAVDGNNPLVYYRLALITFAQKEYEESLDAIKKAITLLATNPDFYIAAARITAEGYGDSQVTLEYLRKAFTNGYTDFVKLGTYGEFDLLRETAAYTTLIEEFKPASGS